jgi:hypothetical protein
VAVLWREFDADVAEALDGRKGILIGREVPNLFQPSAAGKNRHFIKTLENCGPPYRGLVKLLIRSTHHVKKFAFMAHISFVHAPTIVGWFESLTQMSFHFRDIAIALP